MDLQYIVTPEGVKENLILKSAGAKRRYRMNYQISGKLKAVQTDERTIELRKGEETVYAISAPEMTDAKGAVSDALRLRLLEEKNGKLEVELEADSEWLDALERAYPVTVDPSIVAGKSVDTVDSKFLCPPTKTTRHQEPCMLAIKRD